MVVNFKEDYHKIKFKCKQCGECCRNAQIELSPYDVLKLCDFLGMTSSEFLGKHAYFILGSEGWLTCKLKASPECLFLEQGCTVYEERPFGCHVFPLAVRHLFGQEGFSGNKTYILKECPGFNCNKKITVGEFKEEQGIVELLPMQEEWVKFKVKIMKGKVVSKEKYNQLLKICYDFDSEEFKRMLSGEWPAEIGERFKLILKVAEERLLSDK